MGKRQCRRPERYASLVEWSSDDEKDETRIEEATYWKREKKVPLAGLKNALWIATYGEDKYNAKCMCCFQTTITKDHFHAGHIVPESNGGETTINNMWPVCRTCNLSMGTTHMYDFMERHGFVDFNHPIIKAGWS